MSVLIKHMAMPKGCIYANDKDQTEYCPLLNHDEVPFCQYIENEPEIAIGIDERPVYCPLSDVPEPCQDTVSRQAAIDAVCMEWCGVKHKDCEHPFDVEKDDYYWCDGCETALRTLPDLPSAEPERKKGKWIKHRKDRGHNIADCDQCGGTLQWLDPDERPNFCPDCGADMREGVQDEQ